VSFHGPKLAFCAGEGIFAVSAREYLVEEKLNAAEITLCLQDLLETFLVSP
jgi:hypothetical protein